LGGFAGGEVELTDEFIAMNWFGEEGEDFGFSW